MPKSRRLTPDVFGEIEHDDSDVKRVLNDPFMKYYIYNKYIYNEKYQDDISRAADILKTEGEDEHDSVKLVKTATDAILAKKINVFVSYKQEEKEIAAIVIDTLKKLTQGSLNIKSMANIGKGQKWLPFIVKAIQDAHWFLFLLPDPTQDWDWCLFEAGMFRRGIRKSRLFKVFCLHDVRTPLPHQITEFQGIQADPDDPSDIEQFLTEICLEQDFFPGFGQVRRVDKGLIKKAAERINGAVCGEGVEKRPQVQRTRYQPIVLIQLKDPLKDIPKLKRPEDLLDKDIKKLEKEYGEIRHATSEEARERAIKIALGWENKKILDTATFARLPNDPIRKRVGANRRALDVFGWEDVPDTFGELIKYVTAGVKDVQWIAELGYAIRDVADGKIPASTIIATFRAVDTKRSFVRPNLYAVDVVEDRSIRDTFYIVFTEDVSTYAVDQLTPYEGDARYLPYVQIASSIRLGFRIRWEIVEQFKRDMVSVEAFSEAFDRVMGESQHSSKLEIEKLSEYFDDQEESYRVAKLYLFFRETVFELKALLANGGMGTARKISEIQNILQEFELKNQEYLALATKLFARMNEKEFDRLNAPGGRHQPGPGTQRPGTIVPLSVK